MPEHTTRDEVQQLIKSQQDRSDVVKKLTDLRETMQRQLQAANEAKKQQDYSQALQLTQACLATYQAQYQTIRASFDPSKTVFPVSAVGIQTQDGLIAPLHGELIALHEELIALLPQEAINASLPLAAPEADVPEITPVPVHEKIPDDLNKLTFVELRELFTVWRQCFEAEKSLDPKVLKQLQDSITAFTDEILVLKHEGADEDALKDYMKQTHRLFLGQIPHEDYCEMVKALQKTDAPGMKTLGVLMMILGLAIAALGVIFLPELTLLVAAATAGTAVALTGTAATAAAITGIAATSAAFFFPGLATVTADRRSKLQQSMDNLNDAALSYDENPPGTYIPAAI